MKISTPRQLSNANSSHPHQSHARESWKVDLRSTCFWKRLPSSDPHPVSSGTSRPSFPRAQRPRTSVSDVDLDPVLETHMEPHGPDWKTSFLYLLQLFSASMFPGWKGMEANCSPTWVTVVYQRCFEDLRGHWEHVCQNRPSTTIVFRPTWVQQLVPSCSQLDICVCAAWVSRGFTRGFIFHDMPPLLSFLL